MLNLLTTDYKLIYIQEKISKQTNKQDFLNIYLKILPLMFEIFNQFFQAHIIRSSIDISE